MLYLKLRYLKLSPKIEFTLDIADKAIVYIIVLVPLSLDQINFAHRCSRIISIGMQSLMDGNSEQ